MELYQEMLVKICLEKDWLPHDRRLARTLEKECYRVLAHIREILKDPTLDDATCFARIEAIVLAYEQAGGTCGGRHDFG